MASFIRTGSAPAQNKPAVKEAEQPVAFEMALKEDAEIVGARMTDFGPGGSYVVVYSQYHGIPTALRMGTMERRIDTKSAKEYIGGLKLELNLLVKRVSRNGEKYTVTGYGLVEEEE